MSSNFETNRQVFDPEIVKPTSKKSKIPTYIMGLKGVEDYKYPTDVVRDIWIRFDNSNDTFARMYGIDPVTLKEMIRKGGWDTLRQEWRTVLLTRLHKERRDLLEWKQSVIHHLEKFELIAMENQLNDLTAYFEQYGDLYSRDEETKQIIRDAFGNPIMRMVPEKIKEQLQSTSLWRETNSDVLKEECRLEALAQEEKQKEPQLIDMDAVFGENDEDNK